VDRPVSNVKAIFIAALDQEPGTDRSDYLAAACGDNADLRRRVEALLAAHERADEVLGPAGEQLGPSVTVESHACRPIAGATSVESPEHEVSSSGASTTDEYRTTAAPDVVIAGRYMLQQKIGEGGMGEVWVAEQTKPVKRKVALKLIKTGMDSRAVLARFEQERQALAMMDHPNIARVLDGGLTPSGQPFFVMDLVNGLPLTKFCDEARLTTRERLELFVPVCQAVQHAHQKGIVHRDLKPANILVTLIDGKPVPKVIDFGVAKATVGNLTDDCMSTQFGTVVGTLEYMSPEQAEFSGVDIDTRADIYSLGVILYELLTGLRPINGKRLKEAALTEMVRIIQEEEPSKPSARLSTDESLPSMAALRQTEPRKLMALLRGELDWVVMKCLEKKRDRRYDTANGLARDIQRYLADEPVEARPPSAGYRLSKFLRRNKGPVVAAALVLLTLLAGIAGTTFGLIRAEHRRIEALAQREIADKAKIAALAHKKTADDQKQLALDNANKANASATRAELRLAEGLVAQADALSLAGRFTEAHPLYTEAYDKFAELKLPLTAAELGLWSSYHQTTFPLLSFSGHSGEVFGVAIAPDGRTALSGSTDKTLKLWDLASGRELRTFTGHSESVYSVAIAPDGRIALSASEDKTLKIWDLTSGEELRTLTGHSGWVTSVAIASDGRTALSADGEGTLKLWDLVAGKELRTFTGHSDMVSSVAIAPDGRTALSGSIDTTLKLWDLAAGKELRNFTGHSGWVTSVAITPDGRTALSGGIDTTLRLWDLASGKELRTLTGHSGSVRSIAVAPDGRTALSASQDMTLKLWDLASGRELRTFTGRSGWVTSVAIAPDGRTAVSGSTDKTLKLWDLPPSKDLRTFTGHAGWVYRVAIAPDGRTALSASEDRTLKLWDLASGKELRTFTGHVGLVYSVAVAPGGRTALSASKDRTLKLWDLGSGKELRTFTGHTGSVTSVAITPDGRTALSADGEGTLKLWDLATGNELRTVSGHSLWATSVAIAPDGRTGLSGSQDSTLKLWDLPTGAALRTFSGHAGWVFSVAIAPDGRTALSGSSFQMLKLWDLETGKHLRNFIGHSGPVSSIAIAPDGRTALSGSWDTKLKLWDVAKGQELRTFSGHSDVVSSVAIAPDGRMVLSGSFDRTLRLWDFTLGVAHRAFEPRVTSAQARLRQAAGDAVALATLGEWYAFRGVDHWAGEFLARARERGAAVAPLTLARCYWNLNRNSDAQREFRIALEQSTEPGERMYLGWCIQAIDDEPQRERQQEAIAATYAADKELARRADRANSLARAGMVAEGVAEVAELTKNPSWSAVQLYNFACFYSFASTKSADKKNEYADRAMELLHRAVNEGWNGAVRTARDPDLDPLRDREDFKRLLMDLEKKPAAQPGKKP
jgi:eukaryotic-like serine/threonine-protein kinase